MAQPTPQTLRMLQMIYNDDIQEQTLIRYVTDNRAQIDVNYVHEDNSMLSAAAVYQLPKIMKKTVGVRCYRK